MKDVSPPPVLELHWVSHAYRSGPRPIPALARVHVQVAAGEFVCIVGPSGSGKTTLLRIAGGLLRPETGQVLLDGEPLTGPHPAIGFVFQRTNLMPWRTVLDNVLLPLELQGPIGPPEREKALHLLETVGLAEFADAYPAQLSGGMAQRVALVRTLIRDPEVLLLDEPFGALDALTRERLNLELLALHARYRPTVLMVTHSIEEAVLLADRVWVLGGQPGRMVAQVPVDLPRPRNVAVVAQKSFGQLALRIRELLGLVQEAPRRGVGHPPGGR